MGKSESYTSNATSPVSSTQAPTAAGSDRPSRVAQASPSSRAPRPCGFQAYSARALMQSPLVSRVMVLQAIMP